ncbi:hypothetical protein GCM10027347_58970 [Larkinella harenae]
MTTYVILATGQSLTEADVEHVRGKSTVIAVSDAYRLAPWADMLVSRDTAWWTQHPEAKAFKGRKISYHDDHRDIEQIRPIGAPVSCNSGLYAMFIARDLGASKIILLGFDLHGTHFFGPHPAPLNNTSKERFAHFIRQFRYWRGPEVINCTPNSALTQFPYQPLREVL